MNAYNVQLNFQLVDLDDELLDDLEASLYLGAICRRRVLAERDAKVANDVQVHSRDAGRCSASTSAIGAHPFEFAPSTRAQALCSNRRALGDTRSFALFFLFPLR